MNELSTKTWVLILIGGDRHFLTEEEARLVKAGIENGDRFVDLGSVFFATNQFAKLIQGTDYEDIERRKKGDWLCEKHSNWIQKGKQCGFC